jgi:DNA topoisomerase I
MIDSVKIFNKYLLNLLGGTIINKWETLKHNGVIFEKPFENSKDIILIYDGLEIPLINETAEYATFYAKLYNSEVIKNNRFNKNFWNDWKKTFKKNNHTNIIDFSKCDFKLIYDYVIKKKEENLKEDKEAMKKQDEKFKTAYVDGKKQYVSNYKLEPAGIFLGRGCHPKAGKIKKRILPEDIIINIGENEEIPKLPSFYKNHKYKNIVHRHDLIWIASYKDTIMNKTKYVWLDNKSDFKAKSDEYKFNLARTLKTNINDIRNSYYNNILYSEDNFTKQLACALYLVDKLALRVGNEKKEDEAETFGVTSLLVKHISFLDNNYIKLDFLGKDSIRYINTVEIDENVYKNLFDFTKDKDGNDDLFDLINSNDLNTYIKSFNNDLTAKVFRTYNASQLFQDEINKINKTYENYTKDDLKKVLLDAYLKANIKVALLCNHQKKISKTFSEQIKKISDSIKILTEKKKNTTNKNKIKKINQKIKTLKAKRELKSEMKNISITTSQQNYIDPRITFAFMKKHNLKLDDDNEFMKTALKEKFFWAKDVDKDWIF